ncbi:hypothetical protein PoB_007712400 [Plakobranchus ocellatus]|uniref:Uncharacterized protein n=1 Tax=Plakobranchus ocellatus TaxID=259542 RepID=A0AAV4E2D7_9GAST|nr:hypothetical protein PoB_007712400 [Plakobranchus ocellatus]
MDNVWIAAESNGVGLRRRRRPRPRLRIRESSSDKSQVLKEGWARRWREKARNTVVRPEDVRASMPLDRPWLLRTAETWSEDSRWTLDQSPAGSGLSLDWPGHCLLQPSIATTSPKSECYRSSSSASFRAP